MARNSWLMLLLIILVGLVAGCGSTQPVEQVIEEKTDDWAQITYNDQYIITNNTWNKGMAQGPYSQKIFHKKVDGRDVIGWQWQWTGQTAVVAYPEVWCGDDPWSEGPESTKPGLPVRVGSKTITANFDINMVAEGSYNMAFDLWTTSVAPATVNDISHEIMIWTAHNGFLPAGVKTDTIHVGGVAYDVYVRFGHGDASGGTNHTWTYIAFYPEHSVLKGPLNISAFLDYLLAEGVVTTSNYVSVIQFGNELVTGTGTTEIRDYSIDIQ